VFIIVSFILSGFSLVENLINQADDGVKGQKKIKKTVQYRYLLHNNNNKISAYRRAGVDEKCG